jgi:glycosyltransferase involved in cell wall biosynthesis
MHILVITGIFPPDIGGPATYVPLMAAALDERGHQIMVLTLSDHAKGDDDSYSFQVIRLPRRMFKLWRWFRTIVEIIRLGRKADVLFVNGLAMEAVLANVVLWKPMVQKVVGDLAWEQAMNRGWVIDSFEDFQKRRYGLKVETLRVLRTWWTCKADKVVVPSQYLAGWTRGWGIPKDKIVVIYNAPEPCNEIQRTKVPLETPVNLVTVGRLVPWKRVDQIIEALARNDLIGLVVIGDGPERRSLESLARSLDLSGRIYFAGQKGRQETLSLMAACDLFVLNSTYEGFPHVVLEAMGVGVPVVATAVGGTPEVVQDRENGCLIRPTINGALAEAISHLASSPSERRYLAGGAQHTAKRFCLVAMVEATEGVLRECVALRGSR